MIYLLYFCGKPNGVPQVIAYKSSRRMNYDQAVLVDEKLVNIEDLT